MDDWSNRLRVGGRCNASRISCLIPVQDGGVRSPMMYRCPCFHATDGIPHLMECCTTLTVASKRTKPGLAAECSERGVGRGCHDSDDLSVVKDLAPCLGQPQDVSTTSGASLPQHYRWSLVQIKTPRWGHTHSSSDLVRSFFIRRNSHHPRRHRLLPSDTCLDSLAIASGNRVCTQHFLPWTQYCPLRHPLVALQYLLKTPARQVSKKQRPLKLVRSGGDTESSVYVQ